MKTELLGKNDIEKACSFLQQGELVGIPTETVYGLGANGLDSTAVEKIFLAKGRPQDNPLILHIGDKTWMARYCSEIPEEAWVLAEKFWPGPLTLILEAKEIVPEMVRAGLPTVGLRCPDHPVALHLIRAADVPIAAPSGNLSGKPSPTTAKAMLEDMDGKISAIIEGGPCTIGLESTILSLKGEPRLLRAGGIPVEELEAVLGRKISTIHLEEEEAPLAPGMKYRHYAPDATVTVVLGKNSAQWIAQRAEQDDGIICFQEYASLFSSYERQIIGKETDFTAQAQQVFLALRFFNTTEVKQIWAQCPQEVGLGLAVANRLQKAAGFRVIDTDNEV